MVKFDGASEDVVDGRVTMRLRSNWIVTPKVSRGYIEPLRKKVRGHYLITSTKYRKAFGDRKVYARNQTQSRGVPDVIVSCEGWGTLWLAVELKKNTSTKSLTAEQRELSEFGRILIVRNPDELIEAIKAVDLTLGIRRQEPWR